MLNAYDSWTEHDLRVWAESAFYRIKGGWSIEGLLRNLERNYYLCECPEEYQRLATDLENISSSLIIRQLCQAIRSKAEIIAAAENEFC